MALNKTEILAAIVASLRERLRKNRDVAQHAIASATHEEARAEDKYDTRGLEMTYLAAGAADRIEDLRMTLGQYEFWRLPPANPDAIRPGALVSLRADDGREKAVFVAPFGDGEQLEVAGQTIAVVTLRAPLGRALVGAAEGDEVKIALAGGTVLWSVEGVQ